MRHLLRSVTCALGALAVAECAWAESQIDRMWARYADHVPEYCRYTQSLPDKATPGEHGHPLSTGKYRTLFGESWEAMHHYCYGLEEMFEAAQPGVEEIVQRGLYETAIRNFDYVLLRMADTIYLKPEIHVQKGLALLLLDRQADAVAAFTDAISLKNDYVPAYTALGAYFDGLGDLGQAASILRQGLEHAPEDQDLRAQLLDLQSRGAR